MTIVWTAAGNARIALVAHDIRAMPFRPGAGSRAGGAIARGVRTLQRAAS